MKQARVSLILAPENKNLEAQKLKPTLQIRGSQNVVMKQSGMLSIDLNDMKVEKTHTMTEDENQQNAVNVN